MVTVRPILLFKSSSTLILLFRKEGQNAQFEARIAVYFSCLRLSKRILDVDWIFDGVVVEGDEQKIGNLLEYVQEQRLGPAYYSILAFVGELVHNLSFIPSKSLVS